MLELGLININMISIVIAVAALAVGAILSRLYKKVISPFFIKLCDKTPKRYNSIIVAAFSIPTTALIMFLGLYAFAFFLYKSFMLPFSPFYELILNRSIRLAFVVYFTWGLYRASDIFSELLKSLGSKLDLETGKTVSKFFGYIFRGIVLAFSTVIVLDVLGVDVNGLIAGLGLGGLTVALAAKDSASNFFGGLIIILEKPFEVGDWIITNGAEGTVEDVSFRSTKIRTMSNTVTIVPNSMLSAQPITNCTKMKMRRAQHTLMLEPSATSTDLQNVLSSIRCLLIENEELVSSTVLVKLIDFTSEGINISIVYFTKTTDFAEHQDIKEQINLKILDILHKNNVNLTVLRK